MGEIELSQGYMAQVEDADYERCMAGPKWHAQVERRKDGSIRNVYAIRSIHKADGERTTQQMHRFILGITDQRVDIDHEDHDGLNNLRYNLRPSTEQQNTCSRKMSVANSSGYKGVCWDKTYERWMARIMVLGKSHFLGYFTNILDARDAYDEAALKYHKEFALTNATLAERAAA